MILRSVIVTHCVMVPSSSYKKHVRTRLFIVDNYKAEQWKVDEHCGYSATYKNLFNCRLEHKHTNLVFED